MRFQQLTGPVDGQGRRGHRLLPLPPARWRSTRSAATPAGSASSRRRVPRRQRRERTSGWPATHARHVDPRHQAQRGRAGPPRAAVRDPRARGPRPCGRWIEASTPGTGPAATPTGTRRVPAATRRSSAPGRSPADRAAGLHGEGDPRGQGAHVVDRRPTPPTTRRCDAFVAAVLADERVRWPTSTAFVGAARRAGPGHLAGPDAAQARPRPACPTSTRAPSCGTSAWSTPTTAARSTSTVRRALLDALGSTALGARGRRWPGADDGAAQAAAWSARRSHLRRRRPEAFGPGAAGPTRRWRRRRRRAAHVVGLRAGAATGVAVVVPRLVLRPGGRRRVGRHDRSRCRRAAGATSLHRATPRRRRRRVRWPTLLGAASRSPCWSARRDAGSRCDGRDRLGVGAAARGVGRGRRWRRRRVAARAAASGGWWRRRRAGPGRAPTTRFSLDGGPPRPDPRSPWQPARRRRPVPAGRPRRLRRGPTPAGAGVHLPSAVLYELHVGTFSPEGTFDGAIDQLDHLVDARRRRRRAACRSPSSPGDRGWGYDGVDLCAPAPRLRRARRAEAARRRLPRPRPRRRARRRLQPPRPGGELPRPSSGPTSPTATPRRGARPSTSTGRAATRCGASSSTTPCMWLRDYHVDGLRLDAVHAIVDDVGHPPARGAGRPRSTSWRAELGRPLWLIAESDLNDPRARPRRPRPAATASTPQWSDDFHHALHAVLTGERDGYYADFGTARPAGQGAAPGLRLRRAVLAAPRSARHGRPPAGLPGGRFVVYAQNHDQVGNRAARRAARRTSSSPGRLRVGRRPAAARRRSCRCCSRARSGPRRRRSSTSPTTTTPSWAGPCREGRRREFAAFGWEPERRARPAGPGHVRRVGARWDEVTEPAHADAARLVPRR